MRAFVSVLLLATATAFAADVPLTVSDVITGPQSHVRITNGGTQAVTAWALAATTQSDGGRTHREVYTTDGYLSEATHGLPGADERLERLMPGQSRVISLDPLPAGTTVTAFAVVLDDGTAIGDESTLRAIFARRVNERDALRAIVDAFNEVLPTTHGTAALEALRTRFTALAQQEESIPCRAALDAVQQFSRKGSADEVDQSLKTYAAFVTQQYELAAKHSRRKPA